MHCTVMVQALVLTVPSEATTPYPLQAPVPSIPAATSVTNPARRAGEQRRGIGEGKGQRIRTVTYWHCFVTLRTPDLAVRRPPVGHRHPAEPGRLAPPARHVCALA